MAGLWQIVLRYFTSWDMVDAPLLLAEEWAAKTGFQFPGWWTRYVRVMKYNKIQGNL